MEPLFPKSTRFANFKPTTAAIVIIALLAGISLGLIFQPPPLPKKDRVGEDYLCQQSIMERIHAGEGYYAAAKSELRSRGYTTKSIFNWRLPLLAWIMGHLPSLDTGHIIAIILSLIIFVLWISLLQNLSFANKVFASILLWGPVLYAFSSLIFLMHEFWAGILIMLSVAAYARGWRLLSLASGLAALLLRELSLPFVGIMAIFSYIEGNRREVFFWILGIVGFGIFLTIHSMIVHSLITESDLALKGGWIVFGGWPFVLSTARIHPFLIAAPAWISAVIFPLSLLGLIGWTGPLGYRLVSIVGIYVLAFLFVGREFNLYWGLMYVNLLPLGLLYVPYSLRDLWRSVQRGFSKRNNEVTGIAP